MEQGQSKYKSKPSKAGAVMMCRCPRCRKGQMFTAHPYNFRKIFDMHTHCSSCGFRFSREPGFFTGAMYISYALSVGLFLGNALFTAILFNRPHPLVYIINILVLTAVLFPLFFRYSRVIYLYLFGGVKYKPKAEEEYARTGEKEVLKH